jgi:hypothetical protein
VPTEVQKAEADAPGFATYSFDVTASDGFLGAVSGDARCDYQREGGGDRVAIACADTPCGSKRTVALPLGKATVTCSIASKRTHLLEAATKTFAVTVSSSGRGFAGRGQSWRHSTRGPRGGIRRGSPALQWAARSRRLHVIEDHAPTCSSCLPFPRTAPHQAADTIRPVFDSSTVVDTYTEATLTEGAVVTYNTPTAKDVHGPDVSCSPASGSLLPLGNTTVGLALGEGNPGFCRMLLAAHMAARLPGGGIFCLPGLADFCADFCAALRSVQPVWLPGIFGRLAVASWLAACRPGLLFCSTLGLPLAAGCDSTLPA